MNGSQRDFDRLFSKAFGTQFWSQSGHKNEHNFSQDALVVTSL